MKGRPWWSGFLLVLASGVKIYAIVLLPFYVLWKGRFKLAIAFSVDDVLFCITHLLNRVDRRSGWERSTFLTFGP